MNSLMVSGAFFLLLSAAAYAIYLAVFGSDRLIEERFEELAVQMRVSQGALEGEGPEDMTFGRMLLRWAARRIPPPDLDTPQGEKLAHTLIQAGYLRSAAPQTYRIIRVGLALSGGVIALIISALFGHSGSQALLFGFGGTALGVFIPSYYVGRRARKRQNAIARQLSDVLDLLVVCVEAGMGLFEAIKIVGGECERQRQEIGTELSLVGSEISAGATLGAALRHLAERTAVEDIKPLAATLIQSEQLGAQIAPALRASSDALRTRRRLRAEESAQKASIKILFPLVLFVLPSMIAVIIGPAMLNVLRTLGRT